MEDHAEQEQPSTPEQKDARIQEVRDKLIKDARFLKASIPSKDDHIIKQISHISFDRWSRLNLCENSFHREDYTISNLPAPLKNHERIIPIEVGRAKLDGAGNQDAEFTHSQVLITLDDDTPSIYELLGNEGIPIDKDKKITGNEKVQERKELLHLVLDAVDITCETLYFDEDGELYEENDFEKAFETNEAK